MTDHENIDALAAEYVIGTLELSERTAVAARRAREPRLDAAIMEWEKRLVPLIDLMPPIEPPRDIWAKIDARIASDNAIPASKVFDLERQLARWRRFAIAAGAVAALLLVAIGVREYGREQTPQNYVAVFQKDDASPAFLLSVDLGSRQLTIRPVAAQAPPDKTYQLWIRAAQLGDKAISLGLVGEQGYSTRAALAAYDTAVVQTATFGVSLEPAGGSPTGQPTGPVFHAQLIPATP